MSSLDLSEAQMIRQATQEMLNPELSQNIERCIPAHYFSSCLIYLLQTSNMARANGCKEITRK